MNEEIRGFLLEHRAAEEVDEFSDKDSLLETGVIDSLAMIELIAFLEEKYGISIDEDDMIPENFDSIEAIVTYVNRRQS